MPSHDLAILGERLARQIAEKIGATLASSDTPDAATPPPGPDGSWADIDYSDDARANWKPATHLARTEALALAVFERHSSSRPALDALEFWIRRDPISLNWWHNQIGAPRMLANCLLLLSDLISPATIASARPLLDRADDRRMLDAGTFHPVDWTGANLLWISANRIRSGVILKDEGRITKAMAAALSEMRVVGSGEEGIQIDASFHQHGPLLYNGGYGAAFLVECLFFLETTHGTAWQADLAHHRLLADFLLDGTRWMLRGSDLNPCCRGREISRASKPTGSSFANLVSFLATSGIERADELHDLATSIRAGRAPGKLTGNRMFFRSDFMVQQDSRAAFSVRMYSDRTLRGESINGEGLRSHHLADGFTYLTTTGAEYLDIFPVWDWQKLPGTTCLQTPSPEPSETVWRRGTTPVVGGVSDGQFGACMQVIADDQVQATKSWFFGPEGMMCLGAGIQGTDDSNVVTTLDQSLLQGPVEHDRSAGTLPIGTHLLSGIRWLRHGPWGFVFPLPTDVTLTTGNQSGSWSLIGCGSAERIEKDVFLATINHGRNPASASYAYLVVPAADPATLRHLTTRPPIEIVAHSADQQAIWWPAAGRLQAAFFNAGGISFATGFTLRVNRACCVQLQAGKQEHWQLAVSEIRQEGGTLEVELRSVNGEILRHETLVMPDGLLAGSTVTMAW
jgi:chondroitin AC lyase